MRKRKKGSAVFTADPHIQITRVLFERIILLAICFSYVLYTTGCSYLPQPKNSDVEKSFAEDNQKQEDEKQNNSNSNKSSVSVPLPPDQVKKERMSIGDSWEETKETGPSGLLEGKMIYTLISARAVTNLLDVSMTDRSFLEYDSNVIWYENNQEKYSAYPECVEEDGTLIHGAKLILVEIQVKNIDAKSGYAERKGYELDLFKADSILQFCDYGENSLEEQGERLYYPYFFDQAVTDYPETMHPFLFKISPGETRTITLGTLVCERRDGTEVNLSDIGIVIKQNTKYLYFDLGLSDE